MLAIFEVRTGQGLHAVIGHQLLIADIRDLIQTGRCEEDETVRHILQKEWFPHGHGETIFQAVLALQRKLDKMSEAQRMELAEMLRISDDAWPSLNTSGYFSLQGLGLTSDTFPDLSDLYHSRTPG